ncbi:Hypothetical protein PBC10988_0520 [Planctomycetales bacterium 10988]|nr:Hypothetical protein PBC10988_0520 [Planctomycetales bacterium 10988]
MLRTSPASSTPRSTRFSRWLPFLVGCLIFLAPWCVYWNSWEVPFQFDDLPNIVQNPRIHDLNSLEYLGGTQRPLLYASLALNWAISQEEVWSYHLVNILIHATAGWLLWATLLRSFRLPHFRDRFQSSALPLATVIALLWIVHPLQTQSVTYIVQRAESGMACLFLLGWYALLRSHQSKSTFGNLFWELTMLLACSMSMAMKEVGLMTLFVLPLFDGMYVTERWSVTFGRRGWVYGGLCLSGAVLLFLLWKTPEVSSSAGFGYQSISFWEYFRTQPQILWHYLGLMLAPWPLCLDYAWPVAYAWSSILWPGLGMMSLLFLSLFGMWKRSAAGFLGLSIFLILAPTSSFVPIADLAFEHRLYLPLAAFLTLVITSGAWVLDRFQRRYPHFQKPLLVIVSVLLFAWIGTLGTLTVLRNQDYQSEIALWRSVLEVRPENPRAWENLGIALVHVDRFAEAQRCCEEALRIQPRRSKARNGLAMALDGQNEIERAIAEYLLALESSPNSAEIHLNLGNALFKSSFWKEAETHYRRSLQLSEVSNPLAHYGLGNALTEQAKLKEAATQYQAALKQKPLFASAHCNLGMVYLRQGKSSEAQKSVETAIEIRPQYPEAYHILSAIKVLQAETTTDLQQALHYEEQAISFKPDFKEAWMHLGNLLVRLGQLPQAIAAYQKVTELTPQDADAWYNLAILLWKTEQPHKSLTAYRKALQLRPQWPVVQAELAWILATHPSWELRNGKEALQIAESLAAGRGQFLPQAWDLLAAAHAEVGDYSSARQAAARAIDLAIAQDRNELALDIGLRSQFYQQATPLRTTESQREALAW